MLASRSQNNNLEGMIVPELGRLQHLRKLYLHNNNLMGGAEAMQWMTSLKRINVENNDLTGTLPYDIGKLHHLEEGESVPRSYDCVDELIRVC